MDTTPSDPHNFADCASIEAHMRELLRVREAEITRLKTLLMEATAELHRLGGSASNMEAASSSQRKRRRIEDETGLNT